eukprot:TRINITY_DN56036_c0_g1_i1.p1 TRINITY_DN56036_c0_g1~~TRINITY_DN56036_c0_g1_i1.p1  ORF type:complete len:514 (-),score=123.33 TRINITY_DN56036_c0_g1_i1:149-1639(-)
MSTAGRTPSRSSRRSSKSGGTAEDDAEEGEEEEDQEESEEEAWQREIEPFPLPVDGVVMPTWAALDKSLVLGGLGEDARPRRNTEVLNLLRMEWEPGPEMKRRRWGAAALWIDEFRVLIAGGCNGKTYLDDTEVLNIKKGIFSPGPRMKEKRCGCTAVRLDATRFMIIGGYGSDTTEYLQIPKFPSDEDIAAAEEAEMLRKKAEEKANRKAQVEAKRRELAQKKAKRKSKAAAKKEEPAEPEAPPPCEHKPVSWPGSLNAGSWREEIGQAGELLRICDRCGLREEMMRFHVGPTMSNVRACCAAFMLDNRRLMVVGGYDRVGTTPSTEVMDLETAKRYDLDYDTPFEDLEPSGSRFVPGPPLSGKRGSCAGVRLNERYAMVIGGFDSAERLDSTEILDILEMQFRPGPVMLEVRSGCAVVMVKEDELLILGGCDDTGAAFGCQKTTETLKIDDLSEAGIGKLAFMDGPSMAFGRGYLAGVPWVSPVYDPLEKEEPA